MMNFNFRNHDRAVEASPEWRSLSAAGSRWTSADHADRAARKELMQLKAARPHQMDGDHAQRLHQEQLKELQAEADRCDHELDAAKAEADRLKRACHRLQLEGRVETHRRNTAAIIGATRALRDGIIADQQFREQLVKDRLPFSSPLQSMGPRSWEGGGGPGWVDQMLPTIEAWLKEMERGDAYQLASKGLTPAKPRPQPAIV